MAFLAEMSDLMLVVVFIVAAAIFFMLEILTPSFGVLMAAGIFSLAAGIFFAFRHDTTVGFFVLLGSLLGTPVFFYGLVKMLPKTPLSRKLFLRATPPVKDIQPERRSELAVLLDKTGTADTELRPSGKVKIDGHRYDARSESELIEAGKPIKVIRTTVMDLVVREIRNG